MLAAYQMLWKSRHVAITNMEHRQEPSDLNTVTVLKLRGTERKHVPGCSCVNFLEEWIFGMWPYQMENREVSIYRYYILHLEATLSWQSCPNQPPNPRITTQPFMWTVPHQITVKLRNQHTHFLIGSVFVPQKRCVRPWHRPAQRRVLWDGTPAYIFLCSPDARQHMYEVFA